MKIRHSFIVVVAAVCVLWPFGRAAAQPTPAADPTFASLDPRLLVNRTVTVKATDARDAKTLLRVTGKLLDLSDSTLRLQADGDIREFSARDVLVISERYGGAKDGAKIGVLAGGGLGLLLAASCLDNRNTCRIVAPIGAAMIGGGAALGAAIGAASAHERVLYLAPTQRRPRRSGALMITPALAPGAAGLWATYSLGR